MIARLSGRVVSRDNGWIVLDIQGVGYQVFVPAPMDATLPSNEDVALQIHTHVREDTLQLFGFEDLDQKGVFLALLKVKGIGPKLAMAVLGATTTEELVDAVSRGDVKRLTHIPGLGKKTAERILVELQETFRKLSPTSSGASSQRAAAPNLYDDLASALLNLGYKPAQIDKVVVTLKGREEPPDNFDALFRDAMREMR